jgi:transposase
MSLKPEPIGPIPAETERVARAAFLRGTRAMQLRDRLGAVFDDTRFAELFATRGRPVEAPWQLAGVTALQFAEGLSDSQAADAACGRIDWMDALALPLGDPGFDFSVLSEFRTRLVGGNAEHLLLAALLDAVAAADPLWVQAHIPLDCFVRQVGEDGRAFLTTLLARAAPAAVRDLAALDILRHTWIQRYLVSDGQVRPREPKDQPPASDQIVSPYHEQACYTTKRAIGRMGYKTHLTATCDDDLSHLLTEVGTTIAAASDVELLGTIQDHPATTGLLPAEHLVDTGDLQTSHLVASRRDHQVELLGLIYEDRAGQDNADAGFALARSRIDWGAQVVT